MPGVWVHHHEARLLRRHHQVVVGLCGGLVVDAGEGVHPWHTAWQMGAVERAAMGKGLVVKVGPGRVSESLGEGVGLNLKFCDALVLVGGDGGELGLRKDKCSVLLLLDVGDGSVLALPPLDEVHAGLELVHGVQDDLTRIVGLVVCDFDFFESNDLFLELFG